MKSGVILLVCAFGIQAQFVGVSHRGKITFTGGANPAFVDKCDRSIYNTAITSCTISNVTTGQLIVVTGYWGGAPTFTSFTDNCGSGGASDLFTSTTNTAGYSKGALGYALIGANTATCQINFSLSAGSGVTTIAVNTYSGVSQTAPVAAGQASIVIRNTPGAGADAVVAGAVTPTQTATTLAAFMVDLSGSATTLSAGTGYTQRISDPNGGSFGQGVVSEDKSIAGTTATSATFTDGAGATASMLVTALVIQHP